MKFEIKTDLDEKVADLDEELTVLENHLETRLLSVEDQLKALTERMDELDSKLLPSDVVVEQPKEEPEVPTIPKIPGEMGYLLKQVRSFGQQMAQSILDAGHWTLEDFVPQGQEGATFSHWLYDPVHCLINVGMEEEAKQVADVYEKLFDDKGFIGKPRYRDHKYASPLGLIRLGRDGLLTNLIQDWYKEIEFSWTERNAAVYLRATGTYIQHTSGYYEPEELKGERGWSPWMASMLVSDLWRMENRGSDIFHYSNMTARVIYRMGVGDIGAGKGTPGKPGINSGHWSYGLWVPPYVCYRDPDREVMEVTHGWYDYMHCLDVAATMACGAALSEGLGKQVFMDKCIDLIESHLVFCENGLRTPPNPIRSFGWMYQNLDVIEDAVSQW